MTWRVQEKGRHTGYRKYWCINDATQEDYYVTDRWHSDPTNDPNVRIYSEHAWDCNCGAANCAHIAIVQQWKKDQKAKDRAEKAAHELASGERPHATPEPFEEPPYNPIHIDEAIAQARGIPYVPAQPPADPKNCQYWQEESWAQWCGNRDVPCPHRFHMTGCKLRSGPGIYRKVIA